MDLFNLTAASLPKAILLTSLRIIRADLNMDYQYMNPLLSRDVVNPTSKTVIWDCGPLDFRLCPKGWQYLERPLFTTGAGSVGRISGSRTALFSVQECSSDRSFSFHTTLSVW